MSYQKLRKLVIFLAVVIIGLLIVFFIIPSRSSKLQYEIKKIIPTVSQISVKQKIYITNDNIKQDNVFVNQEITALEILKQTTKVETKGEGKNAFVISIDNIKVDDKKKEFWSFNINGKPATIGAGSYILKDKDLIEWMIENY